MHSIPEYGVMNIPAHTVSSIGRSLMLKFSGAQKTRTMFKPKSLIHQTSCFKESTPRIVRILGDNPGCPCDGTHVADISDIIQIKFGHKDHLDEDHPEDK